ncbi:hypothetical protein C0Q44_15170 [Paenibacillus sp. PCH8]|uniref:transglycosylase domain-containing protein n=1 Tax=Paenibacillus sp. PCH8 TaxID=2066524 RepID=UPI000CF942AC|nr:transglycosylase domain-containing protein [Paenibacillus sp. PCH8]PQP82737.1 hypothetical protein C0Q44_15170 [Paenibacillus sp. PCH8]
MLRRRSKRWIYHIFDATVAVVLTLTLLYLYLIVYGEGMLRNHPEAIQVAASTLITNAEGNEISRLYTQTKGYSEFADLNAMPDLLIMAFLATEDRRFYSHDGLDFIGVGRAIVQDIIHMDLSQGGSSITQQLARNLYLNGNKTWTRKVNEISIAMALEKKFKKDEILELYLNHIYMGRQQYGVKAAAVRYFGITDLHQLELWQIATLAGIPKGPSIYNPVDHPSLSKQRRSVVHAIMHEQGLITRKQMLEARHVDYTPSDTELKSVAAPGLSEPAYVSAVDAVIQEASRITGKSGAEIQSAGWTIHTGLNRQAQLAMEQTFRDSSRMVVTNPAIWEGITGDLLPCPRPFSNPSTRQPFGYFMKLG